MENTIVSSFQQGLTMFMQSLNWFYIIAFIVVTWLMNDISEAKNRALWLNWFAGIPKVLRTLVLGVIILLIFGYFTRANHREQYFELFMSLIFSMVLWKIGLDKIFGWISSHVLKLKK